MCLLCSLCQWPKCSLIRIGNILFKIFFSSTNPIEPMPMYVCWYWITSEKIWKYADIRLLASKSQIFINCIYIRFHSDYIVGSWHRHLVDMEINNLQHKKKCFIQLNDDSLYPFACWSICSLCLLILMRIILMLILIESRSMLIVHWLYDKLMHTWQNTICKILTSKIIFWKFKVMYWKTYFDFFPCRYLIRIYFVKKKIAKQRCKLGHAIHANEVCPCMNANEEVLAGNADADATYHDADLDAS